MSISISGAPPFPNQQAAASFVPRKMTYIGMRLETINTLFNGDHIDDAAHVMMMVLVMRMLPLVATSTMCGVHHCPHVFGTVGHRVNGGHATHEF